MSDLERITALEQEVKNLHRLVREMAAREKLQAHRFQLLARDSAQTDKIVRGLDLSSKKTEAKPNQTNSQVQSRK